MKLARSKKSFPRASAIIVKAKKAVVQPEAMASPIKQKPMKETFRIRGKDATRFFGKRPGQRVTALLRGKILDSGVDRWDDKRPAFATIEIDSTSVGKG